MIVYLILLALSGSLGEKPCRVRQVPGESVVCVCDATYCDTVERQEPASGSYVSYTSSQAGFRFIKSTGPLQGFNTSLPGDEVDTTLQLDPCARYQTIKGFGGAVTDAAGANWRSLPEALQQLLIESYFGATGIGYNFIRVPIGGCDFSTHTYAYNEVPENDVKLMNFSLTSEDYDYKIPMIKAAAAVSQTQVLVLASTWSPPRWMKTNNAWSGYSMLKSEYYQTYADYHLKFLEHYASAGVCVWGVTTTNEPFNDFVPLAQLNSMGWTYKTQGKWIAENLGPTIRNSTYKDVQILAVDDQRTFIPIWFTWILKERPDVLDWIDGVSVHWYEDTETPASVLQEVTQRHPDKFLLATEASQGFRPYEKKVLLGSWSRAEAYIRDIIEDLDQSMVGWIDWNLCLNAEGGPNWTNNSLDSAVIVYSEAKEFVKQPMFYAIGHFSKFVPRGSRRIGLERTGKVDHAVAHAVAFVTPMETVVVIVLNESKVQRTIRLRVKDKELVLTVPEKSITTVELSGNNCE